MLRRRNTLPVLLVTLALCAGLAAAEDGVTLEQILSSPFPSSLTAAPGGKAVAWVFNERGVRNIWVAHAPDWQGSALTDYSEDDGQEIAELAFDSTGARLAFVRGGPPNSKGELPNPLSDPAGVTRAIWIVPLLGAKASNAGDVSGKTGKNVPEKLAEGSSPLFHPDGASLLYLNKGEVWSVDLADGAKPAEGEDVTDDTPAKPKALIKGRGKLGSLCLSPDGSRLALVSDRDSHSFVGVYSFADQTLRFLDPSVDRDLSPVWSPAGTSVAFLRLPARSTPIIFGPQREGQPWSIRIADAASGKGRELWRAETGRGSAFRAVEAEDQLFFTSDGFLVFPWERDGWTHLYSVPASGGTGIQTRLLTPGEFEVEYVSRDETGTGVVFSSNQNDIDRRHLWHLRASGGPPSALTSGTGVENDPIALSGGAVAFVGATGRRPLQPGVRLADGTKRDLAPGALAASYPVDRLVEPEPVVFRGTDGLQIHGQLFRPAGASATSKRPGLLFFHGGSRRHMMLGWHYSSYYHNCYAFHQYMASRGFVVLSVNYRSGTGYGMEFREALDYGATGASELNDVLGAGLYLQSRPDVDWERVGLWGGSYGGYLTAMGLARASNLFRAGVDIHGVHDWNEAIRNFMPSYNPLEDPERTRLAFESSPLSSVDGWRSPVLLVHGDDDRNVPFSETLTLAEKLRELGVEHELLVFPDEVHGFLTHRSWLEVFERSEEFLKRHLGG